jgi:hypothetical protein
MARISLLAAVSCLLLLACGPAQRPAAVQAGAEVPAAGAQPGSDEDIPRWVLRTLIGAGYQCNEDSPTQMCMTQDDRWIVNVTTRVEADRAIILFDSFVPRTAHAACHTFRDQMAALRSDPSLFSVSCTDSAQQFRMNTALQYHQDLDVSAWIEEHRRSRYRAWQELAAISATAS